MRTLVAILMSLALLGGVVPLAAAQTGASADVYVSQGLALPRDHKYESYDEATKKYTPIDVRDVPSYVQRKERVFDRTAHAWVVYPKGNLNKRYAASATTPGATAPGGQWQRVTGTVQSIQGNDVTIRTDDGRLMIVDISQARWRLQDQLTVGERVSAIGHQTSPNRMQARAIRDFRGGQAATQGKSDGWEHIHGTVQAVQGSTLRFRADDGRMLNVDMSKVGSEIQQALTQGEGATVIGYEWMGNNRLRAEYIQQDSSDPSRGGKVVGQAPPASTPAASPAAKVDEKAWQRIHGTVQSVQGENVTVKADDGRVLKVHASKVSPDIRKSLTAGEGVTVIGFYRGHDRNVFAEYIQKDSSQQPAASPKK